MSFRYLIPLLFVGTTAYGEPSSSTIPPGEFHEPLYLNDYPANTTLNATGVVLYGGKSDHFNPAPTYSIFKGSRWDPANGTGYPDTETLNSMDLPGEERYPLQLRDMESPTLRGVAVIGVQSSQLPWRVMKAMWDGDAVHVKHCTGTVTISDVYFKNVEDGLGPMEGLKRWKLERAWMKDIRDDAVENDDFIDGEITNCLIDGCFVFLSHRAPRSEKMTTKVVIRDSLIRVAAQPHDGTEDRTWRNRHIKPGDEGIGVAPGMFFKWERDAGEVEVRDSIFYMSAISINGVEDMGFPPGTYENVTLIWTGPGNYPGKLPRGVTQIHDATVWEEAKNRWIRSLPEDHPGLNLPDRP